jgi:hypothetical protein
VGVDAARRRGQAGLERGVQAADRFPVGFKVINGTQAQAGGPVGVVGGGDDRRQRWLAGCAGHGSDRAVHGVRPRLPRGQQGGELASGGVMGVQMDGQVEAFPQRGDQRGCRRGTQQPRHVLDG